MLRRVLSCRRGAVAVEGAIILPVLVLLVVGVMEYGILLFTFMNLQSATREVARAASVNFTPVADVPANLRARLPSWSRDEATITVSQSAAGSAATNVITVTATIPSSAATPIHLLTAVGGWDLKTVVAMKQEQPL